mgnify:CR=1 FL=1
MELDNKYTILAVDDAKDTLMLLDFDLSAEGYQVITATSGEECLATVLKDNREECNSGIANASGIDLILLDLYMPSMSGLQTLEAIKGNPSTHDIPVIMLSASNDENEIVDALELGADDYVTKPYIAKVLLARIKTSLRLMTKSRELEILAKTDFLTKLNNRANFYELSTKVINQSRRNSQNLVVAMFDIDFFKQVNDNYGHDVGDKVLVEFAQILLSSFRNYDVVSRIGGEEFAVCMPCTKINEAMIVCERLRKRIEAHKIHIESDPEHPLSITVSIGLTPELFEDSSQSGVDTDSLLKLADQALYQAKSSGRNTIVNSDDVQINTIEGAPSEDVVNEQNQLDSNLNFGEADKNFPGIDFSVGLVNVLNDEALLKEILVLFYEDHNQDGEKLIAALNESDFKEVKHLAHTLKGVACSIGAMTLFEHTKMLDNAVNEGEFEKIEGLFKEAVEPELLKVITGIKNYIDQQTAS